MLSTKSISDKLMSQDILTQKLQIISAEISPQGLAAAIMLHNGQRASEILKEKPDFLMQKLDHEFYESFFDEETILEMATSGLKTKKVSSQEIPKQEESEQQEEYISNLYKAVSISSKIIEKQKRLKPVEIIEQDKTVIKGEFLNGKMDFFAFACRAQCSIDIFDLLKSVKQKEQMPLNLNFSVVSSTGNATTKKESLLLFAIRFNNTDAIEFAVKNGCNPDDKNFHGFSALQLLYNLKNYKSMQILLDNGADPNCIRLTEKDGGNTLLHRAANVGNLEAIKVLFSSKIIDVNKSNYDNENPLQIALKNLKNVNVATIKLLLEHPKLNTSSLAKTLNSYLHEVHEARNIQKKNPLLALKVDLKADLAVCYQLIQKGASLPNDIDQLILSANPTLTLNVLKEYQKKFSKAPSSINKTEKVAKQAEDENSESVMKPH